MRAYVLTIVLSLPLILAACGGSTGDSGSETATEAVEAVEAAAELATAEETTPPHAAEFPAEQETDTYASSAAAPLPGCDRIWAADLVGDAADEVICGNANVVQIFGADGDQFRPRLELEGTGLPNAAWSGDRDGDGRDEFVIAFGMGRGFATAPIRVLELDAAADGTSWQVRTLFEKLGERPQVTSVWGPDLYLAHFVSKYEVTGGHLLPGNALRDERVLHMGMARVLADLDGDGHDELAVGRVYGDEPRSDGDLTVYDGDTVTQVLTFRGVRALTAAHLDGADVLVFGDGWHFKYRDEGKGRLNIARQKGAGFITELVHELPGQYAVTRIEVEDIDGDGQPEIVASGNDTIYLYRRTDGGWSPKRLGTCLAGEFTTVRRAGGKFAVAGAGSPVAWHTL
jgi:hypothetical protein